MNNRMRCAVCGKEFGEGVNCLHCGVDRVTGLANYNGYGSSNYQEANTSYYDSSYNSSPKTMVCYACSEIIPADSEYCPHCRKKLYETCPKCGAKYSSQYRVCNKCGTDRSQYYLKLEAKKQEDRRRERARQIEIEHEKELSQEAFKLCSQIRGDWVGIWWVVSVLIPFIIVGFASEIVGGMVVISVIVGCLFVGAIGQAIIQDLGRKKVERWKQEHPNDPRSKYL